MDAAECMPNAGDWPQIWREQEDWKAAKALPNREESTKSEKVRRPVQASYCTHQCCQKEVLNCLLESGLHIL